jgi:hypothetical protein
MSERIRVALREARRALGEVGERGRTSRVPDRARRAVVAYVAVARSEGLAWRRIVEEVGVSESALRRWCDEGSASEAVSLLPVEVIGDESAGSGAEGAEPWRSIGAVTLVSPGGYRVEGLGVEQLAALLSRVG